MDDSEQDLTKLVHQLARRVPSLELDDDVVREQVQAFKTSEDIILKKLAGSSKKKAETEEAEDSPFAKIMEEMKTLPTRVAERLVESGDPINKRRSRRIHPMMLEELMLMSGQSGDPVEILMVASLIRDDIPWLYELTMEVYRAAKSGDADLIEAEIIRLQRFSKSMMRGPFIDALGLSDSKEAYMFAHELPIMLERSLRRELANKPPSRRRSAMKPVDNAQIHSDA